jgi:hypothetical protein
MATDPARNGRRRRAPILWLVLLAVLLLVALALGVRACGDESGGADTGPALTASEGGGEQGEGLGGEQGTIPTEGSTGDGLVTAGEDDLLAAAGGGGSLEEFDGRDVSAQNVLVQEVVDESGFWVGGDETRRVFVEVEGDATSIELAEGDRVGFTGVIEPNLEAESYGLRAEGGAEQFRSQGYHVQVQAADLERQ